MSGYSRYQCDCQVQQRHECQNFVHQNGDICAQCQVDGCGDNNNNVAMLRQTFGASSTKQTRSLAHRQNTRIPVLALQPHCSIAAAQSLNPFPLSAAAAQASPIFTDAERYEAAYAIGGDASGNVGPRGQDSL